MFAVMFMILNLGIQARISPQELPLKSFLITGLAQFVGLPKRILALKIKVF